MVKLYEKKLKNYDTLSDKRKAALNSDEGFSSYRNNINFTVPDIIKNAYTEWERFRELFPNKDLDNSELIAIRDLYCSDLKPNDFVSMIYFDNARKSLSAGEKESV